MQRWIVKVLWTFIVILLLVPGMRVTSANEGLVEITEDGTIVDDDKAENQSLAAPDICELGPGHSTGLNTIPEFLNVAQALVKAGKIKCPGLGSRFGNPWRAACPTTIEEVLADVDKGCKVAEGGKSGAPTLICGKYFLKVIPQAEFDNAIPFLSTLRVARTMIAPICRLLRVKRDKYLLISVNGLLRTSGMIDGNWRQVQLVGSQGIYDLKGNYAWRNRNANHSETVKKDLNFKEAFPHGLNIVQYVTPDFHNWAEGLFLIDQILKDTRILFENGLMDYSFLLHVLEVSAADGGDRITIQKLNKDKPVFLARVEDRTFVLALSIVDFLMHEGSRGIGNYLGSAVTLSSCTPGDLDPIPAEEYRVRFMRMFGVQIYYYGVPCAKCLFGLLNSTERSNGYTYFPTKYQIGKSREGSCEWAPGTPSNGVMNNGNMRVFQLPTINSRNCGVDCMQGRA